MFEFAASWPWFVKLLLSWIAIAAIVTPFIGHAIGKLSEDQTRPVR